MIWCVNSGVNGATPPAEALDIAWRTVRAPGITVVTPRQLSQPGEGRDRRGEPLRIGEPRELARGRHSLLEVDTREGLPHVERLTAAVVVAVVVLRKDGVGRVLSAEQARREGNARDDRDTRLGRRRQHALERLEPEGVENDLDARDVWPLDRDQCVVDSLDADAVSRDRALVDEGVQAVVDLIGGEHFGRRAVQLHEVERVGLQVRARAIRPRAEVLERVVARNLLDSSTRSWWRRRCRARRGPPGTTR